MSAIVNVRLIVGQRYLLRYRSDLQRLDRTAVMVYLGKNSNGLVFSARPVAGTQEIPRHWLRAQPEPVAADTPIHLNRIVR